MYRNTEKYIELAKKQVELFHQNNQTYIDCLVKFDSMRHIMTTAYFILVRSNRIKSVESIGIKEKTILWQQTKEYAAGRIDKATTKELALALYTLEYLI